MDLFPYLQNLQIRLRLPGACFFCFAPHFRMPADLLLPTVPWTLRPLTPADVDDVMRIQAQTYGAPFKRTRRSLRGDLAARRRCSLGVQRTTDASLLAYAAAYWSAPGSITPLNGDFELPIAGPSSLYLHDISVLPALAGQKVAHALVVHLIELARSRHMTSMGLVPCKVRPGFGSGMALRNTKSPIRRSASTWPLQARARCMVRRL